MKTEFTLAQNEIISRINKKTESKFVFYADYIDEPYGDYYDTNSEEPH